MDIRITEFKTAREAIAHAAARDCAAVLLNGKPAAVSRMDAERMESAGVSFAYLCDHKGAVVTVPVNGKEVKGIERRQYRSRHGVTTENVNPAC